MDDKLYKTIIEIDNDAADTHLPDSIDYQPDSNDDCRTQLDDSASDDYVSYGGGFTFQAEGIDDENRQTPLSNHLQPDMTIRDGRFRIIRVLGAGGFGVVYLAYDSKLNIEVAIKELYPSSLVNRVPGEKKLIIYGKDNARQYAYLLDRFILEARSMAKFNSVKNIVNIFDCFQENNTAYIVMEYIKGRTLEQYVMDNGGHLSIEKATELMNKILDGLSAIHSKGIIHRDIKPKNIFITPDNGLKIIDFGAARFSSTEEQIVTRYSKVLTPGFAPPEQYRKDSKQGSYTDVYAASAVYYYMVTGTVPEISVDRVVKDELKPLSQVLSNVPDFVERAISRALELNSDLRLQSASELKNGLNGKKLIRYVAEEKKMRFRRRLITIATTAAVLCAAAIGVIVYKLNNAEDITIDRLVSKDTNISIGIPLAENNTVSGGQLSAWENVAQKFEAFVSENSEREIELELRYYSSTTYDAEIAGELPTVFCSSDSSGAPEMEYMGSLINEETTILYDKYMDGTLSNESYIIAFDPTVLYVNEKLLEQVSSGAEAESFDAVSDILKLSVDEDMKLLAVNESDSDYYSSIADLSASEADYSPLEEFCMGDVVFYIGHASDSFAISEAMPGFCTAAPAPDVEGVRAVGYEWCISGDCGENELNAAQLLLSFVSGDDMQDALFVQSGNMIPVNPAAYEKFMEYNPQLAFLDEEMDGLYFAQE